MEIKFVFGGGKNPYIVIYDVPAIPKVGDEIPSSAVGVDCDFPLYVQRVKWKVSDNTEKFKLIPEEVILGRYCPIAVISMNPCDEKVELGG